IGYAHRRGVLHNDISPKNILVTQNNEPIIIDFDFASEVARIPDEGAETQPVVGTLGYLAPERTTGRADSLTSRSDIYSLGAVLYLLVCERPAFVSARTTRPPLAELLVRAREEVPTPPRASNPAVHPQLEAICLRSLAKNPDERYASADEMADD